MRALHTGRKDEPAQGLLLALEPSLHLLVGGGEGYSQAGPPSV